MSLWSRPIRCAHPLWFRAFFGLISGLYTFKEIVMTTAAPTATAAVAEELVTLCRAGKNMDAINSLYSPDIVSVESMSSPQMPQEARGLDAIRQKGKWWSENNEVHSAEVEGPFLADGDSFAVHYKYEITPKQLGKRVTMDEMALYTAKDGKIVREQFFYKTD
jgi:ketosteroid isomerase-like protein